MCRRPGAERWNRRCSGLVARRLHPRLRRASARNLRFAHNLTIVVDHLAQPLVGSERGLLRNFQGPQTGDAVGAELVNEKFVS